MAKSRNNIRTDNGDGTTTIQVEVPLTVWVTVPTEHADGVSAYDVQDQLDYLVSDAAENIVGDTLDPIEVEEWDEDGMEITATHEVEATITGVGY